MFQDAAVHDGNSRSLAPPNVIYLKQQVRTYFLTCLFLYKVRTYFLKYFIFPNTYMGYVWDSIFTLTMLGVQYA